jgi:hypothetical protein
MLAHTNSQQGDAWRADPTGKATGMLPAALSRSTVT